MAGGKRSSARIETAVIIETETDLVQGVRALRDLCRHMRRLHDSSGDPPLRRMQPGFAGLLRIVVGQQLSTASADAIWRRTLAMVQPLEPETLLACDDATFRAAGLSRPKIRTLRALAGSVVDGRLDLARMAGEPDAGVRAALTSVSGIGPWTADIYLMFCLGRADSWASGDLALQLATQSALSLHSRPGPAELELIAERWRPWRSVAARLLWADYGKRKSASMAASGARGAKKRNTSKTNT